MLVPTPYQASERKAKEKGKEAKSGLRRKGASNVCPRTPEPSPPLTKRKRRRKRVIPHLRGDKKKKRAAFADLEVGVSKKGRTSLTDDSQSDADEWRPRPKPLAES